jgi:MOSC domain-containing protein YiiM
MRATIVSLSYQSAARERVTVERVRLIAGHGIDGDRKAGHHPKRHLNIMSHEIVSRLTVDGVAVQPGQLGEQVIVAGIDLAALPDGTRLRFGESAVVEITMLRTGCSRYGQLKGDYAEDVPLGVMARVLEGGALRVGDAVRIELEEPAF